MANARASRSTSARAERAARYQSRLAWSREFAARELRAFAVRGVTADARKPRRNFQFPSFGRARARASEKKKIRARVASASPTF